MPIVSELDVALRGHNVANIRVKVVEEPVLRIVANGLKYVEKKRNIPSNLPTTTHHSALCPSYRNILRYVQILARWVRVLDVRYRGYKRSTFL